MAALTLVLRLAVLHLTFMVTARSASSGKLVEFSCTQQQVNGKYVNYDDGVHGINFTSKADGHLLVRNLGGEIIVETGPFSEENGKGFRFVTIMGHKYVQHTNTSHADKAVDHDKSLYEATQKIFGMREITLLREAAEAIGKEGHTGKSTPATLPFFMFALKVTQLHTDGLYNTTSPRRTKRQLYANDCLTFCPPCRDEACYGLCGYGCWCWEFLCGDCCFHVGCYYHDTCCRQDFLQTRCLLPYDFVCDQEYYF